jgi:tRNA A37 methylthiotransferase MiaB
LVDDISQQVKIRRVNEVVEVFRRNALALNQAKVGTRQLALAEGPSKRSPFYLTGRNDANTKVIFPQVQVPHGSGSGDKLITPGDYVVVEIEACTSQTLTGRPLFVTTLSEYNATHEPYAGKAAL